MSDFTNINGYKVIFFIENLLREYIKNNFLGFSLDDELIGNAQKTAIENGVAESFNPDFLLDYLHLGQLFDLIKSKKFQKNNPNSIQRINISPLIRRRNTIMHSRYISYEQYEEIKNIGEMIAININDPALLAKWNKFISSDIESYHIPLIYVEYPLGKNFERLIGREEELRQIKELLKRPFPLSIIRHGGLGKTALILQLVEDLLYSPSRPFEFIFFMSFKNSVFEDGVVRKLEKVISNHFDLIMKLASYMNIKLDGVPFEDVENEVWKTIFNKRTLLVLDNLETEIVRSNLSEFTEIADRFLANYTNPSRLIITSRLGLGDSEKKFPLLEFNLEQTKELIYANLTEKVKVLNKAEEEDWEWVQNYTCGNPGLILSFCDCIRNSNKTLLDLRVEFLSKYTSEARQLYDAQDVFLEFCFTNTTESLSKESQVFISALSYLFLEVNFKEISEELLSFLLHEIGFIKLGIHNVKAQIFVNIGFLRPITGSDKYYINDLFVTYINGNYSGRREIYDVFALQNSEWFSALKQMVNSVIEFQHKEELSVSKLLSSLYKAKYEQTKDAGYLVKAFFCETTLNNLQYYFEKAELIDVINNFSLVDKVKTLLIQDKEFHIQERIIQRLIFSMSEINHKIKKNDPSVVPMIRQNDLYNFFQQIRSKFSVMRKPQNVSIHLRRKIVDFLIAINQLDIAENYILDDKKKMLKSCFKLYSKQVGVWAGIDKFKCEKYIIKCNEIINDKNIDDASRVSHYVYLARYYRKDEPLEAYKISAELDKIPKNNLIIFSFYLESLLIRIECLIQLGNIKNNSEEIKGLFKEYYNQKKSSRYKGIRYSKRRKLEENVRVIERKMKRTSFIK